VIDAEPLKQFGRRIGIEIRLTPVFALNPEIRRMMEQSRENLFLNPASWTRSEIEKFCDPRTVIPQAKSAITACLNYLTPDEPDPSRPGKPYGLVARYTRRNYYRELRRRLRQVGQFVKKEYGGDAAVYANGPFAEKPLARRSGIGFYGKHSIIINPRFGSWCVLGEGVTDIEFEPDRPLTRSCGRCRKCIDACPTGAIIRPYVIDRRICIQALTNWLGVIPGKISRVWSNRIYGCTTCQEVCPKNEGLKPVKPETEIGVVGQWLSIPDILVMKEEAYRARYSNNQMSAGWINFPAIRRNCLIALGNARDTKTLPIVNKFLKDQNPMLAATARWAKRRIQRG
jgi:epoxyqueuosine reductase